MGKKSTPKAPPPVDYNAAAQAQGAANVQAAQTSAELNNQNQVTPYGNQTFTKDPNSNQWTSTIDLSPDQQRLYDLQTQGEQALGEMGVNQLGRIQDAFGQPLDLSGAPARVNSVNGPQYSLYGGQPNVQSDLDFSSLGAVPGADQFADQGKQVQDTLYRQATQTLDPQYKLAEDQERTRLANQGVAQGTEAFDNAMSDFYRSKQTDYGNARDRSILASGNEQSRLNSDALASRNAMFNQILTGGNFHNAADEQKQAQLLQGLGFNNQAEAQQFIDSITSGNFQNNQRGAAIDEAAMLRNDPLNAYNALATGAQVTNPNFRGTAATQGPAAAPVFAGTQAGAQDALSLYNSQMDAANSASSGLMGTIGTVAGGALVLF
jgi:hypothetical protein